MTVSFPAINGRRTCSEVDQPARGRASPTIIDQFWPSSGPVKLPTPGDNGTGANDWVLVLDAVK